MTHLSRRGAQRGAGVAPAALPAPRSTGWPVAPAMELVEKEKECEITAELPGIDEKNVDIKLSNHTLTIKGEKTAEKEEKDYLSERRYVSFRLPEGVDADKIEANRREGRADREAAQDRRRPRRRRSRKAA